MIKRKTYIAPMLEVQIIHFEQSIAVGSATVTPINSSSQIEEEWDVEADDVRSINW